MVKLLNEVGVPVSFERVLEIARSGVIGRPHVARAIVEVGWAASLIRRSGDFLSPAARPLSRGTRFPLSRQFRPLSGLAGQLAVPT